MLCGGGAGPWGLWEQRSGDNGGGPGGEEEASLRKFFLPQFSRAFIYFPRRRVDSQSWDCDPH